MYIIFKIFLFKIIFKYFSLVLFLSDECICFLFSFPNNNMPYCFYCSPSPWFCEDDFKNHLTNVHRMNMEPVLSSMLGWDKKNWVSGPKRKEPETDQGTPFAAMRNAMGGPTPRQAAADTDYNEETDEAEETLGLKILQVVGSLDGPGATEGPAEKIPMVCQSTGCASAKVGNGYSPGEGHEG